MPIADSDKTDFLWKKLIFGASKTADGNVKGGPNETIPSPLPVFGSNIWTQTTPTDIPPTPPVSDTAVVGRQYGASAVRCTSDPTSPPNTAWLATSTFGNLTSTHGDWIPPTFGADYVLRVWIGNPDNGPAARIFADAVNEDWVFDYTAGVLFFPNNIPANRAATVGSGTVSVATNGIFIEGFRYVGLKGVSGGGDGFSLSPTGVTPGTYSLATVAVDATGRITFAESSTGGDDPATEIDTLESVVLRGNQAPTPILITDDSDGALTVTGGGYFGRDLVIGSAAGGGRIELDYPGGGNGTTGFWQIEVLPGSGAVESVLQLGVTPLVGQQRNLLRFESSGTIVVEGALNATGHVTGTPFEFPLYAHTIRQTAPTVAGVLTRSAQIGAAPAAVARLVTAPQAPLNFVVRRNGSQVGSISFAAGNTAGSASLTAGLSFAAGDVISLVASGIDVAAEGLMFTLGLRYT